jgi:hypothetical protein
VDIDYKVCAFYRNRDEGEEYTRNISGLKPSSFIKIYFKLRNKYFSIKLGDTIFRNRL